MSYNRGGSCSFPVISEQRLDELTEWCRNKPDEAACRIIQAEGRDSDFLNYTPTEKGDAGSLRGEISIGDKVVCTETHGNGGYIINGSLWVLKSFCSGCAQLEDESGMRVWADPNKIMKINIVEEAEKEVIMRARIVKRNGKLVLEEEK